MAYGATKVYTGLDLTIERGERTVLVGPNGAGKSTLLKLLAANVVPQQGERELGHNVKAGYYSQYRVDMLDPSRSVLDEALDTPQKVTEQFVRTLLGSFLFRGDDVFKKVSVLSGGEKSRLALVKLLLDPPNLLLMDEPTTHLDMSSIDALLYALDQFEGTLIFISHDVYFIRALAQTVLHVHSGRLTPYAGDYDYYLEKSKAGNARAALTAGFADARPKQAADKPAAKPAEAGKARPAEIKKLRTEVGHLEEKVSQLEARQNDLTADLEAPETYASPGKAQHLNRELSVIVDQLQTATTAWEVSAARLADLEKSS